MWREFTTFRYFNESKAAYFKPEKSQSVLLSAIERRELVVLTSKIKFQKIGSFIAGFGFTFIFLFFLFIMIPRIYRSIAAIIITVILIGVIIRAITIVMYLRNYFIVLDSNGIYYRKTGTPRFIPWTEVVEIVGYLDKHFFAGVHKNERTVGLGLKSKKIVRFNAMNYNFKGKYFEFDVVFITFKFRRCDFFRYGLLAYKNRVEIFKP